MSWSKSFPTRAAFNSRPSELTTQEIGTTEEAKVAKAQNQYGNACALVGRVMDDSMVGNDDTDYVISVGGHAESTPFGDTIYVSVASSHRQPD